MSAAPTDVAALLAAVRAGDRRTLGRLLTAVEDGTGTGREVLRTLDGTSRRAHLVGVTGPPGAGKSSLVSALVGAIRGSGRTVAVLAVDPSSPITGGAILGDRVRMQLHAQDPGVFIRSMASRGQAGGLAAATRDAATLLARSGFDLVLVETVGAGQGEIAVADLVDTTLVVEAPGMGDEVQALKAGLMELADLVVVSKADLPGADHAAAALRAMLTVGAQHDRAMGDRPRPRRPEVLLVSSTVGTGLAELLAAIDRRAPAPDAGQPDAGRPGAGQPDAGRPESVTVPPDVSAIVLRPLESRDSRALFGIFRVSLDDLILRQGSDEGWPYDPMDEAEWARWRPVYEHLADTADLAIGAELEGRLVAYARSIRRGDARELTELFVLPEVQAAGVGRRLLEAAFPDDVDHRAILASSDAAALARYLSLGVTPSTTVHTFRGPPAADPAALPADVRVVPMAAIGEAAWLEATATIDASVLGTRRDMDHAWLGRTRVGWLLERDGLPVGYAYASAVPWNAVLGPGFAGPIGVLEPELLPGAIGLLEGHAGQRADAAISLWVPLAASHAVRYLLARGYRLDPDPVYLMEDRRVVATDRYIVMSPPFTL